MATILFACTFQMICGTFFGNKASPNLVLLVYLLVFVRKKTNNIFDFMGTSMSQLVKVWCSLDESILIKKIYK